MKKIGFIGLGIMGKPMAKNLIRAGYDVTAYDVSCFALRSASLEGIHQTQLLEDPEVSHIASNQAGDAVVEKSGGEIRVQQTIPPQIMTPQEAHGPGPGSRLGQNLPPVAGIPILFGDGEAFLEGKRMAESPRVRGNVEKFEENRKSDGADHFSGQHASFEKCPHTAMLGH